MDAKALQGNYFPEYRQIELLDIGEIRYFSKALRIMSNFSEHGADFQRISTNKLFENLYEIYNSFLLEKINKENCYNTKH